MSEIDVNYLGEREAKRLIAENCLLKNELLLSAPTPGIDAKAIKAAEGEQS